MKPEVEAKVSEALLKLWMPIADSIGIRNIVINDVDDRKLLYEKALHLDNCLWEHLVESFENAIGNIAKIWNTSNEIRISLDDIKEFSITITRESYDDEDDIDASELEEMTREEAIEYLTELSAIPSFEYAQIEICTGNHYIQRLIYDYAQYENFSSIISPMIDGLLQTPMEFKKAVKAASIELQKKAEKQREMDNRIKAEKEAEARLLIEFASKVEPLLINAGWHGKYRVSMNFNNYVLSLQLTSYDECRYESITQSDVISKIGELVRFANAYRSLKIAGGIPVLHGNEVKSADWKELKK